MYGLRHPITLNKYFNINHLPNFCMLYEGSGLGQIINTIFVAIMQHKSEENEAKPLRMYGLEIIFCAINVNYLQNSLDNFVIVVPLYEMGGELNTDILLPSILYQ